MKIAILGTRGIPNHYGGFEQVTEFLSEGLAQKGHDVFVYNSHNHPYQSKQWKNVNLIHCYDPEYFLKTAGQFIYDWNCIRDAGKRKFDIILMMGYTSSSAWWRFFPKDATIVCNMDGLEWKRSKYSKPVQKFLRHAEKLAALHSDFHIADAIGIRRHLSASYGIEAKYIPYGAEMIHNENEEILDRFNLLPGHYFMTMARMEPENNIEMILRGFQQTDTSKKLIVIGNMKNRYAKTIRKNFADDARILFKGSLFEQDALNTLRKNCSLYFHGHSVGGTNPSLLEAMASPGLIAAHDNIFNRAILKEDAFYFASAKQVSALIENVYAPVHESMKKNNLSKIKEQYNWQRIIDEYHQFLCECYSKKNHAKIVYDKGLAYK